MCKTIAQRHASTPAHSKQLPWDTEQDHEADKAPLSDFQRRAAEVYSSPPPAGVSCCLHFANMTWKTTPPLLTEAELREVSAVWLSHKSKFQGSHRQV